MRARDPDIAGHVQRDGVRVGYEVFGEGPRTILLMPSWAIVNSGLWKAQVPQLARRHRVVTFDARGSGRSERPDTLEAYSDASDVEDAVAVLDAVGAEDPVLAVGMTFGCCLALMLA